jgi:hypothetical protein
MRGSISTQGGAAAVALGCSARGCFGTGQNFLSMNLPSVAADVRRLKLLGRKESRASLRRLLPTGEWFNSFLTFNVQHSTFN